MKIFDKLELNLIKVEIRIVYFLGRLSYFVQSPMSISEKADEISL